MPIYQDEIGTFNIKTDCLNQRFYSLDVFRGATVCLMILVNNPGNWSHIYPPLDHAEWHGLTPTDLVFPFFLFAVGNALSFVMPRLQAGGDAVFWKKVITRSLLIYLIGLFLTWWPFVRWSNDHLVVRHWVDPKNPENYILLGDAQLEKNPTDGSAPVKSYQMASTLNPKSTKGILREGKLYQRGRNYQLALDYYKKAIGIDPLYAPAYREIAELYSLAAQPAK